MANYNDPAPLRLVTNRWRLGARVIERLECGHRYAPDTRQKRVPLAKRRRCWACYDQTACPICEGGSGSACAGHFV